MIIVAEQYIILGAGGHAKPVVEALEKSGNRIAGFTDQSAQQGEMCCGYPILGKDEVLFSIYSRGVRNAAVGIGHVGNASVRNRVYREAVQIGFVFPNIVHPASVLSDRMICGNGIQFLANCVVNAEAEIGSLCIINTGAVVEHEAKLGDGVHVAPRAVVLGQASVGDNTFVGAGSVILQGVHVGKNCIIGAGSVVLHDVEDDSVIVGNPGQLLRRRIT